ncbi:MAG: putative peptidoglycan binding domain [Gaiellaceae bacterium]|jgi:hypothetical protein|nr:putative peptidoglycan binding domain [Gaiellaceae bacterium]
MALTLSQFPYTGPLYGPSHPEGPTLNRSSVKGIKRAMIRLRYLDTDLGDETDDFGGELERALKVYQREVGLSGTGQYGRGTWTALRYEKLTAGPNKGQYAVDALAREYVQQDALRKCHPHEAGVDSSICQGLHQTSGLLGNWAIDFCADGGTKVVAVEAAKITKLSGRDPALGELPNSPGIFGWSIHYETPSGYRYFSTHYGWRANLAIGTAVDCGQVLGTVGDWPNDPPRSHTHLGVTSPLGTADAKKRITEISKAPRVVV